MEHTIETTHEEHHSSGKNEVKRVTIILTVLTLVELALGFWMMGMDNGGLKHAIKGTIIILMLAKAFYIVAYFMHLGHELRNLIMTIVVPLGIFIWFIIAFLRDGDHYRNMRVTYDRYKKEQSTKKAPAPKEGTEHAPKHGGTAE
jgi:cytochrome c oxidase subunit 4